MPPRVAPLTAALVALVVGIVAAPYLPFTNLLLVGVAVLCFVALPFARRCAPIAYGLVLLPVFLFGVVRAKDAMTPLPTDVARFAGKPSLYVRGVVTEEPRLGTFDSLSFPLQVEAVREDEAVYRATGTAQVTLRVGSGSRPTVGETLLVRGQLRRPDGPTNPGGFDYAAYLAQRGIFTTLTAKRTGDVRRVAPAGFSAPDALRNRLQTQVTEHLPRENAALLCGLLLSIRDGIPAEVEDAFVRTGTVHILSTSGLHMTLVAGIALLVLRLLPIRRDVRVIGTLFAIALVWLYALAAGAASATVRSALMATILLAGPIVRRHSNPLHALVVAGFGILVASPLALYEAGTQLSFVTVTVLLLWMPAMERLFLPHEWGATRRERIVRWVLVALTGSVVAHLAAAPLVAYHFHQFSTIAPLANLVLVPLTEAILLLGLGTAFLSGVPVASLIAEPLWIVLGWLLNLTREVTFLFAEPTWATLSVVPPPVIVVLVFYLVLGGVAISVRRHALVKHLFAPDMPVGRGHRYTNTGI